MSTEGEELALRIFEFVALRAAHGDREEAQKRLDIVAGALVQFTDAGQTFLAVLEEQFGPKHGFQLVLSHVLIGLPGMVLKTKAEASLLSEAP